MAVYKIVAHPITKLNGVTTKTVPAGSRVIGAIGIISAPDVVHALICEPIPNREPYAETEPETEEIRILCVTDQTAFSDPAEDEFLNYVGTVVWDNAYRINHIFQICAVEDYDIEYLPEGEEEISAIPYPPTQADMLSSAQKQEVTPEVTPEV